jgi:sulfite reductase beta subunit-like hemoprotein
VKSDLSTGMVETLATIETGTDVLAAGHAAHLATLSSLAEQLRREIRTVAEVATALMDLVDLASRWGSRATRIVSRLDFLLRRAAQAQ